MTERERAIFERLRAEQVQRDEEWREQQAEEAEADRREREAIADELTERVLRNGGCFMPGIDG